MVKLDWTKPIEMYKPSAPSEPTEPAEVVAFDLRGGGFKVGIRWAMKQSDSLVCADDYGRVAGSLWRVRNVPTQVTKYILLSKRLNPGENPYAPRVVTLYNTYDEAKANCDASHKVVEVTYEV